MTAIDLNAGDHAWMQPNGDGDRYRNHPMLRDLDLPPLGGEGHGGPLLTKTLLISALSAGGSDRGPRLVARDKATGAIVASVDLPAGAIGTPMTYLHEGRQYIALTIGGDVPELIALALPQESAPVERCERRAGVSSRPRRATRGGSAPRCVARRDGWRTPGGTS